MKDAEENHDSERAAVLRHGTIPRIRQNPFETYEEVAEDNVKMI
ncbi:hypothetical protein QMZ09_08945 [Enterococcus faecalis]